MSENASHRLSQVDKEKRTAICSACGPVDIRSKGTGRFVCAVRKRERRAGYAERHPDKVQADRRRRSSHRLVSSDPSTMTGVCPVCGPVGVVIKGRAKKDGSPGVMCGKRAEELWPGASDEAPQPMCSTCSRAYLDADGTCRYCGDREQNEVGYGLKLMQARQREAEFIEDWYAGELTHLFNPGEVPTTSIEGDTVSNPSLKVIGAGVIPPGTNPQKFIQSWLRDNAHLL